MCAKHGETGDWCAKRAQWFLLLPAPLSPGTLGKLQALAACTFCSWNTYVHGVRVSQLNPLAQPLRRHVLPH